jgi:hypothetical protein
MIKRILCKKKRIYRKEQRNYFILLSGSKKQKLKIN